MRYWNALSYRPIVSDFAICCAIVINCLLVNPFGEYVMVDDWAYTKSLEYLSVKGELRILQWNPMSLVGHLFWTYPFVKVFGFSMTCAKLSVVVLHLIECLVLRHLLRFCGVGELLAFAATLMLIFNPLHFLYCYTYMTDIPSITWQLIAAACYVKSYNRDNSAGTIWLLRGSFFSGLAFLVRQSGLLVPLAYLGHQLLSNRKQLSWRRLLMGLGPFAVILSANLYWFKCIHGETAAFSLAASEIQQFILHPPLADLVWIIFAYCITIGFFLIPLAISMKWSTYSFGLAAKGIVFTILVFLFVDLFLYYGIERDRVFPYIINVISPFGYFNPNALIPGDRQPLWGRPIGWTIGIFCLISILAFLNRLLLGDRFEDKLQKSQLQFFLLLLLLQFAYLVATSPIVFDRHLLLVAPTIVVTFCLLCRSSAGVNRAVFMAGLLPLAFYSIAATHDIHAESRTAFIAGTKLIENEVNPLDITAGYAFDGWHNFESWKEPFRPPPPAKWWELERWKSFDQFRHAGPVTNIVPPWWVGTITPTTDPQYVVLVSTMPPEIEGYVLVDKFPFQNWWPYKRRSAFVLKKILNTNQQSHSSKAAEETRSIPAGETHDVEPHEESRMGRERS